MRWARRFNRIALILLVVAVGRTDASLPDAEDSLQPATWLVVAMPSEASESTEATLAGIGAAISWIALADAARQRHVFVVGAAGPDPHQHGAILDRLEATLTPAIGPDGAVWRLEERTDLCHSTPTSDLHQEHRVARYEFQSTRMAKVQRRLRRRLLDARADPSQQAYVVLEGRDPSGLSRLVILEPPGRPPDRRLASLSMRHELLLGSLQGVIPRDAMARASGQVAHRFAGDRLLYPLEPLPEAQPSMANVHPVEPDLESERDAGESARDAPAARRHSAPQPLTPVLPDPRRPIPVPPLPARSAQDTADDLVEPAPPLRHPTIDSEATRRRVASAVEGWARAWSSQRVADYFASYARDFQPTGRSLERWRADRRDRIGSPRIIDVRVADIDIELLGQDRVRVVFEQAYRSDRYNDRVRKQLDFVREDGAFKIARELVLQVLGKPGARDR